MLRRTSIGNYSIREAQDLSGDIVLTPLLEATAALYPTKEISEEEVVSVHHGKPLKLESDFKTLALSNDGKLVAISELSDGLYRSQIVITSEDK